MKVRPLFDRVLIKRVQVEKKSAGGLYLPESTQEARPMGTVTAVGPGKYQGGQFVETKLKEGDFVLFGKHAGVEVTIDGAEYYMMREEDVIGVVEN